LLVTLNFNGQTKICQFYSSTFGFAGQQQILRLKTKQHQ
jgi:hypothetical protein